MPQTSLSRRLEERGGHEAQLVWSQDRIWSLADLLTYVPTDIGLMRTVTLHLADPIKLVSALVSLDGYAERIALASGDMPLRDAVSIAVDAGGGVIVTDSNDETAVSAVDVVRWVANDEGTRRGRPANHSMQQTRWVFATSGTTGTPKLVEHTLEHLLRAIKTDDGRSLRWGLLFNAARFAGAQVMLQGLLGGGGLLLPPNGCSLNDSVAFFGNAGCTALSATPTMWRKILMTSRAERLTLRQITLGGEIADATILNALSVRFPHARLTHIYASTEAGTIFPVHDGLPGFPSAYLELRLGRPEVQVRDSRLYVRLKTGSAFYVGTGAAITGTDGFVDTGDIVRLDGDRFLFVGRANGSINVGGNKLHPDEVEAILLRHPDVLAARVYGKKNSVMGELVAAELVSADGDRDTARLTADIRLHCGSYLDPWKVPAIIRFVTEIATNTSGKAERKVH